MCPPQNKPTKDEIGTCPKFLYQELMILKNVKTIICLGKISYDSLKQIFGMRPKIFS